MWLSAAEFDIVYRMSEHKPVLTTSFFFFLNVAIFNKKTSISSLFDFAQVITHNSTVQFVYFNHL